MSHGLNCSFYFLQLTIQMPGPLNFFADKREVHLTLLCDMTVLARMKVGLIDLSLLQSKSQNSHGTVFSLIADDRTIIPHVCR